MKPSLESFRKTHPHCHPQQVGCLLADFVHFALFCIILPGKFWYMHKMKGLLEKNDIPTFLCEPVPGKDIVEVTKDGATNLPNICQVEKGSPGDSCSSIIPGWAGQGQSDGGILL